MKKIRVYSKPIAHNVCQQMLREIGKNDSFSVAHVTMNAQEASVTHLHQHMVELYIVTRGCGNMLVGEEEFIVRPGNVIYIPKCTSHKLTNIGMTSLEHFVFAFPPFQPDDIVFSDEPWNNGSPIQRGTATLPPMFECFDGAKIISYEFPNLDISIAFGSVLSQTSQNKKAHCHRRTTEWIYVVEGDGQIDVDGIRQMTSQGDFIEIPPGKFHALRNETVQHQAVICICRPRFDMADVHFA